MTEAKKADATKKAAPKKNAQLREAMDARDAAVLTYLKDHADIGIPETAELLSITSGAAGTCLWRLRGCPVGGVAKKTVHIERAEKAGRYKLVKTTARRARKAAKVTE